MIKLESLADLIGVDMWDVIEQYNILNFVYDSCKQSICDLKENLEFLDFVDVVFEMDNETENDSDYLIVHTDCIAINISYIDGLDTTFQIYYATPNGEILTSDVNIYDIKNYLDKINLTFSM